MPSTLIKEPFHIQQGEHWSLSIALSSDTEGPANDLSGFTPKAAIRRSAISNQADVPITATLAPDPDTDDPNREIRLEMLASETRAIAAGRYEFGLELVPPEGDEYTVAIIHGWIEIHPEVVV